MCLQINVQYFGFPCLYFTCIFVLAQRQDSVAGGGRHKQILGGAGKLYFFEFECVDQKSVHWEIRQNLGNRPKKVFILKNTRMSTNSDLHLKKCANFHEI